MVAPDGVQVGDAWKAATVGMGVPFTASADHVKLPVVGIGARAAA